MRIAVIGAGSVGATLGQAWLKHGEDETWGLRNPADPSVADQGVAITTMSASLLASLASCGAPWPVLHISGNVRCCPPRRALIASPLIVDFGFSA